VVHVRDQIRYGHDYLGYNQVPVSGFGIQIKRVTSMYSAKETEREHCVGSRGLRLRRVE
jgi:hypothetical protein